MYWLTKNWLGDFYPVLPIHRSGIPNNIDITSIHVIILLGLLFCILSVASVSYSAFNFQCASDVSTSCKEFLSFVLKDGSLMRFIRLKGS